MNGDSPDERTEQRSEPVVTDDNRRNTFGYPTVGITIEPARNLATEGTFDSAGYLIGDRYTPPSVADPTGQRSDIRASGESDDTSESTIFFGSFENAIAAGLSSGLELFAKAIAQYKSAGRSRDGSTEDDRRSDSEGTTTQAILDGMLERIEELEDSIKRYEVSSLQLHTIVDKLSARLDTLEQDTEIHAIFDRLRGIGSLA